VILWFQGWLCPNPGFMIFSTLLFALVYTSDEVTATKQNLIWYFALFAFVPIIASVPSILLVLIIIICHNFGTLPVSRTHFPLQPVVSCSCLLLISLSAQHFQIFFTDGL
jgi:hypothetical protein